VSKFTQLGIYVIRFGNRESSICKDWHGLQPDFASGGPISCVKFRVTRRFSGSLGRYFRQRPTGRRLGGCCAYLRHRHIHDP